jgi:hypothetical protein
LAKGRHSSGRSAIRVPAPLPIMAVLLVLIVAAWFSFQYLSSRLDDEGCGNPTTVTVAAEAGIAPALAEVAAAVARDDDRTLAGCYRTQILSVDSATIADRLTGIEEGDIPDAWVPDSTYWLRRARAGGAIDLPEAGASLASSPVVLAVVDPAARRLGWPDKTLRWDDVLGANPTAETIKVGLADPARNPVGLAALFGVRAVTSKAPAPAPAQVAALRRLSPNVSARAAELFDKLPPSHDPAAIATSLGAFPTSEQAVLRHNSQQPTQRLVPVYADPAVPALDYPYVVLSTTTGEQRAATEKFLNRLLDPGARKALQARGLRTAQGEAGADFPGGEADRPVAVEPLALPPATELDTVLAVWTGVNLSARLLAVIDVSGSMNGQIPGTGLRRIDATVDAAQQGLGLFKDTTDLGLWAFSNNLDGDRDYRQLAPIGPLSTQRARLIELAGTVRSLTGGNTNLYDTVLAAYQTVKQGWDPARLNVVVVLTDGRDDDVSSIDRDQLIAELTRQNDPKRPLRIIFVGIGQDVDAAELNQIAAVTGGRAFTTPNPAGIREVFAAALAELTCIPPECVRR